MATSPAAGTRGDPDAGMLDPELLGKGLAALRIFFGLIAFSNGLAKLFGFGAYQLGPYKANLINREETRGILEGEAARNELPLLPELVTGVLLPGYGFWQWVITAVELGVGALLILGLASRGAALVGLGQHLFLQLLYISSGRWAFEQPHEWVPLLILTLVPSGFVWGLDRRIRRRPRFPF